MPSSRTTCTARSTRSSSPGEDDALGRQLGLRDRPLYDHAGVIDEPVRTWTGIPILIGRVATLEPYPPWLMAGAI